MMPCKTAAAHFEEVRHHQWAAGLLTALSRLASCGTEPNSRAGDLFCPLRLRLRLRGTRVLPADMHAFRRTGLAVVCSLVLVLSWPARCAAYSVLAHEAIIDSAWDASIKPVLLKRFPNATPDELRV